MACPPPSRDASAGVTRVVVFAPSPVLTVVIEDRGGVPDVHVHAGGQGVWQARMVSSMGVDVTVCAALGGETGRLLRHLIADEGLDTRVVDGAFTNGSYVHDRRSGERVTVAEHPGDPLPRHVLDEVYGLTVTEALDAGAAILSGPAGPAVVPDDIYRRLASDLGGNGCPVVADLAGDRLAAALDGGLAVAKVSHEELGIDAGDRDALLAAVADLHAAGARAVVVSRADRPALALTDDGLFEVRMPRLAPADPRGAGDSMTAGMAAALARGLPVTEAVRVGAAAGALNVTRHGLGTGDRGAIEKLTARVDLVPLPGGTAVTTPDDLAHRLAAGADGGRNRR
ncbi:PfkB family carbohydrate kinase [Longispora sp. K20-0274]|uniref:1-phosphofructokinase family hexose kinase n=1 Tax=Longispora sp. K20-0274 TaxID=3088255 RepID=UPI0039994CF1